MVPREKGQVPLVEKRQPTVSRDGAQGHWAKIRSPFGVTSHQLSARLHDPSRLDEVRPGIAHMLPAGPSDHEIERFGSEARVLYRAAHHIQVESGSCVVGRKGGGIDTIHLAPRVSERAEQKPERTSDLEDARATSAGPEGAARGSRPPARGVAPAWRSRRTRLTPWRRSTRLGTTGRPRLGSAWDVPGETHMPDNGGPTARRPLQPKPRATTRTNRPPGRCRTVPARTHDIVRARYAR